MRDDLGEIFGGMIIARDVTEQTRRELEKTETRYFKIFQANPGAINLTSLTEGTVSRPSGYRIPAVLIR